MTEQLLSPDLEQLHRRRYELSVALSRLALEWSEAWEAYVPYCPWDAVNERVMATRSFATRYRELQAERDALQC